MFINEKELYITLNGLGRASIVKRKDGLYCLYIHCMWSEATRDAFNVKESDFESWDYNGTPLEELYDDVDPEPGLYGTIVDARSALLSLPGFTEARLSRASALK